MLMALWYLAFVVNISRERTRAIYVFPMLAAALLASGALPMVATAAAEEVHSGLDLSLVQDPETAAVIKSTYALPVYLGLEKAVADVTRAKLDFWVENERRRLRSLLLSLGYLSGQVALNIIDQENGTAVLKPITGPQYHIGSIELDGVKHADLDDRTASDLATVLLAFTGQVASSEAVQKIADDVIYRVRARTYGLARVVRSQAVPDPSTRLAHIIIEVDAGPAATFGGVVFRGLRRVSGASLLEVAPFRVGQAFDWAKLELFASNLRALGKFSQVRVATDKALDTDGQLTIHVNVMENPINSGELTRTGMLGAIIAAVAISVVGLRQFGVAVGAQARFVRLMTALAWIVVPVFFAVAVLRVFSFLAGG
ncbi:POTRA domain-containing protein [Pseudaminobacter soli (ex Li et al. 2025)]|nr:POTRA domain-containing protein [Mesorhizobium soli]